MNTDTIIDYGRSQSVGILEQCMKDEKNSQTNLKLASATSVSVLGAVLANAVILGASKDDLLDTLMINLSDEIDMIMKAGAKQ